MSISSVVVETHMEAIKKFVAIGCKQSHPEVRRVIAKYVNDSLEEIGKEFTSLEELNLIEEAPQEMMEKGREILGQKVAQKMIEKGLGG